MALLRRPSFMIKTSFKRFFIYIYIFPRSVVNAKMVFRNIVRSIMTVDSNLNQAVRISK